MRRIVVGVDSSPGSAGALAWALDLARETGAGLEAVHAWSQSYPWTIGFQPDDLERWSTQAEQAAQNRLNEAITACAQEPSVQIERVVVEGQPAQVLIERAKDADLLVVGSHGRGGFVGLLLGSVSQQCVEHASVPVVVVPERD